MHLRSSVTLCIACAIVVLGIEPVRGEIPSRPGTVSCAVIVHDRSPDSFERAVAAAEAAGARAMQMLPPETFFARFPARPSRSLFQGLPVELVFSSGDVRGKGLGPVAEKALGRLFDGIGAAAAGAAPAAGEPVEDVLLRVPPEIIRAATPAGPRLASPGEIFDRGPTQNSEFLIGTVLVNIVFPESDGGTENWTQDEISGAVADLMLGIQQYLDRAGWMTTPLRFIYNYRDYVGVPVSIEPIESNMDTDYIWISEAMAALGYSADAYFGPSALNNATRSAFDADWVFTAFVADMSAHYDPDPDRPDPGCWGGAGYVAYAYLGGPYLVIPYPACRYGYGLGFGRVFIHEMSHIFWALDEYVSGDYYTLCTECSGYLNVPTLNTLFRPDMCGSTPVECIMQTASPPFESPLPICETTQGQVGLYEKELGAITVPAIYSLAPEIEFVVLPGLETDTVLPDGEYLFGAHVTNPAVPNLNSQQPSIYRIDYAAELASGEISINEMPYEPIRPSTGAWDSSREDIGLIMDGSVFEPGLNSIQLRVRNIATLETIAETQVFAIGIKYFFVAAEADSSVVEISWVTPGEVFGAAFSVLRSDDTIGETDAVVSVVTEPVTAAPDRRAYAFTDTLVRPGHRYRYRIVASFEIDFRGEHLAYEFPSAEMSATALIPIAPGAFVSSLLPNPTRGPVSFTVEVPMSYQRVDDSRAPAPNAARLSPALIPVTTFVDITVYNVLGQRLRTIFSGSLFGGYMSLVWDGAGDSGALVPPGVYFLSVTAGGARDVRKVVIVR